jgi:hypothetical protein
MAGVVWKKSTQPFDLVVAANAAVHESSTVKANLAGKSRAL